MSVESGEWRYKMRCGRFVNRPYERREMQSPLVGVIHECPAIPIRRRKPTPHLHSPISTFHSETLAAEHCFAANFLGRYMKGIEIKNHASAAPRALQASMASSSGASLQMTLSQARETPAAAQSCSQFCIHSPPPQP